MVTSSMLRTLLGGTFLHPLITPHAEGTIILISSDLRWTPQWSHLFLVIEMKCDHGGNQDSGNLLCFVNEVRRQVGFARPGHSFQELARPG